MTAYLVAGRVMLAHLLTKHLRMWQCGVICGLLLHAGFSRTAGQAIERAPDGVTARAIRPEAAPPFYPDVRILSAVAPPAWTRGARSSICPITYRRCPRFTSVSSRSSL